MVKKHYLLFLLREFQKSSLDLRDLRYEIEEEKPDWIVYITPAWQQEYVEMCFTAAKLEGWIKTDLKGNWNPSLRNEYPVATYAGYRTCSTEHEELANLLEQVRDRCEEVAQGNDAQMLGYTAEAVFQCVLMYTCLKNHRLADCTFSFAEMVEEEILVLICSNSLIYREILLYLLHCLAEIHRITNDSRKDVDGLKNASDLILEEHEGWGESEECMLTFHLLEFTEVLEESCLSLLPHMMCKYLYDLTKKYNSYNDFLRKAGPVVETSRLLMCEATAVVMRKCFQVLSITPEMEYLYRPKLLDLLQYTKPPMDVYAPLTVEVGVEPYRKEQKMAEIEQRAKTQLDLEIVDRFITPFVSGARNPLRKSRFEVFSIRPSITTDCEFEDGNMFGLISVSDKYGLRSDVGTHLFEPDFPYVAFFNHEWCDPIKIHQNEVVYLGNPTYYLSVPFSSSIQIRIELYVTTEKKDDCYQLCNLKFKLDLKKIWDEKSYSKCDRLNIKGEDGRTMMYCILLKDAVDVDIAMAVTFKADLNRKVYGYIHAFYGGEFSYDCRRETQDNYMALLFRSFLMVGQISLKRSVLAVPKNASLNIKAHLVDADTNEVILSDCYEFLQGRRNGTLHGFEDGASLDMKDTKVMSVLDIYLVDMLCYDG
ncbi:arginine--tRNA ligase, chloroplastic/mitochondrial [Tanacetum coccineum]